MHKKTAIVVGSGILGLAMARALAINGFAVKVFERSPRALGASIRNFGMVWPIGQPDGPLYARAKRSRQIWTEICRESGIWMDPVGSLHLACHEDEWEVLQELREKFSGQGREVSLLGRKELAACSSAGLTRDVLGGLFSSEEIIVDPREALGLLPGYLHEKWGIEFFWGNAVSRVSERAVFVGKQRRYEADWIFVCSGSDFETLFPDEFSELAITKCKLQMMKFNAPSEQLRIGPALCGGLSLIHYKSFEVAPSLNQLKRRFEVELKPYLDHGIHVMVSQNGNGELIVGDSHEYGLAPDPFDKESINHLILSYLQGFVQCGSWTLAESWNGIYPKMLNGATEVFLSPEPGVFFVNGVGGAGMTLSFGLAEELVATL